MRKILLVVLLTTVLLLQVVAVYRFVAAREIGRGEFIGTFIGPAAKRNGSHVLWVYADDGSVTGRRGQNLLRYVNHASPCNAAFDGFDLYARKRIRRDEEITIDYGWSE